MKITELKRDIKDGDIKTLYLFHGPEGYLIEKYLKQLKDAVLQDDFNYYQFDDTLELSDVIDIVDQYPQLSERKMLVLKNSGILKANAKEKKIFIENLPNYMVVVFVEKDAAKLSKALVGLIDNVVKFEIQKPSDLRAWTLRRFADMNKKINPSDAEYLVQICEMSLGKLEMEAGKLCAAAGENESISRELIGKLVAAPIEYKVFDFVNLLLNNDSQKAYVMMADFKYGREEPIVLLSIIFSQISSIIMVKNLRDSGVGNIEGYFAPNRRFLVSKITREMRRYNFKKLRAAMRECAEFDLSIKTGKLDPWAAIELVVANLLKQI